MTVPDYARTDGGDGCAGTAARPLRATPALVAQRHPALGSPESEELRADLAARVRLVRADGWDGYLNLWPPGTVATVAYLLADHGVPAEFGETTQSVMARLAYDLFGPLAAREEAMAAWPRTREWLAPLTAAASA